MQKIVKFPLFLALLLGAVLATSCDRKDIHQVISLMTETPADTTGFAQKDVRMSSFSAVVVDCFADVSFFQTAPEESPRVVLMAKQGGADYEWYLNNGMIDRFILSSEFEKEFPTL